MGVFVCYGFFDRPQTGGQLFYAKIFDYLGRQPDVDLLLPTETDVHFLNRPYGSLGINRYFFQRFRQLLEGTIIVESEHYYYDFFLANWLVRATRGDLRILVSALQVPEPLENRLWRRWARDSRFSLLLRSAHAVTVNSRYLGRELISQYGVRQDRIHVVHSAAQVTGSSAYQSTIKQNASPRLFCVAHIRPLKGQAVLIEALSHLRNESPKLSLVGETKDNKYEQELRALIAQLGLSDRVQFVGRLEGDDLVKMYASADICVVPSLYEAYGIVVQEAMSFGVSVVASNVGSIPEQLTDGVEGILVPPGDSKALADALRRLIASPQLRAWMGEQGRRRAAELPTWDQVCERFYRALLTVT